jgi:hypothetical protein
VSGRSILLGFGHGVDWRDGCAGIGYSGFVLGALGAGENKVFLTLSANAASSFSSRILQLIKHQRRAKIAYAGSTKHYVIFVYTKEGEKWYAKIMSCTKLLGQVII